MADYYVYVDPVSGNDGTGAGNANASTAETTPYKTLVAAVAGAVTAGENNRTSKAGSIHFRLLAGLDNYNASNNNNTVEFMNATWTTDTTNRIKMYGHGTGKHDGDPIDTTNGYTLRRTCTNSGNQGTPLYFESGQHFDVYDFRVQFNNTGTASQSIAYLGGTYGTKNIDRMLFFNNSSAGNGITTAGNSASDRRSYMRNSVILTRGSSESVYITGSGSGGVFLYHNTIISTGSGPAVLFGDSNTQTLAYNYAHSASGSCYSGGGWAGSTRTANASSDTTGDSSYQSIAYSTSSGAYFTNVTSGSEDFRIGASSALKDAASGSTDTTDVIGATRSTPDIGAFEYIAAGGESRIALNWTL